MFPSEARLPMHLGVSLGVLVKYAVVSGRNRWSICLFNFYSPITRVDNLECKSLINSFPLLPLFGAFFIYEMSCNNSMWWSLLEWVASQHESFLEYPSMQLFMQTPFVLICHTTRQASINKVPWHNALCDGVFSVFQFNCFS